MKFIDGYLMTRKDDTQIEPQVGDIRVSYQYVACGPATVMAQQIQKHDGTFTFRQWNPKKIEVPVGENNDFEYEGTCLLCVCCTCVDKCFQSMFPETIEFVYDKWMDKEAVIQDKENMNYCTTYTIRFLGWLMLFLGICFLCSPLVTAVSYVPIFGWLLSYSLNWAITVTAFLVSLAAATVTVGLAWLYYRPVYGVVLLSIASVAILGMTMVGTPGPYQGTNASNSTTAANKTM